MTSFEGTAFNGEVRSYDSADQGNFVGGASGTANRIQVRGASHPSTPNVITMDTNGSEKLRLDASGNLGIGVTPSEKLHIDNGSSNAFIRIDKSGTFQGLVGIVQTAGSGSSGSAAGDMIVRSQTRVLFDTAGTTRAIIDASGNLQFNSGYGSVATAYGCRAWVNFNGIGTVAIRSSGNVSSITDNGTGDYKVNFTSAMPDANYATVASKTHTTVESNCNINIGSPGAAGYTTSLVNIRTIENGTSVDTSQLNVAIFR